MYDWRIYVFQCVMDVKDFNPNDLQVKVVEDRVVVEGKYEKVSFKAIEADSKGWKYPIIPYFMPSCSLKQCRSSNFIFD